MEPWDITILLLISSIVLLQVVIIILIIKYSKKLKNAIEENKNISNQEEYGNDAFVEWKEEVQRTTELQWMRIRNAIQKQSKDIHKKEIELAPKSFYYDFNTLKKIYTSEQIYILQSFYNAYQNYLKTHWYTSNNRIKTVFSGSNMNQDSELGRLTSASDHLCKQMDVWFDQLKHHS